jgi:hypothetical protein
MNLIKHYIKKYFQVLWMRHKYSPEVQIAQRALFHFYALNQQQKNEINLANSGFKVFSQFEEDGKILFILACIGMRSYSFIEVGSDDGVNSNCANLAMNFGFHGLFIDGNPRSVERGKYFYKRYPNPYGHKPTFQCAKVTRENINDLISASDLHGEVDVLSIDIDGNDYWIWDAITVVSPRIVIIETFIDYGLQDLVVPYDPSYSFPGQHPQYHGASPVAMVNLGRKKGYRLIGANNLGFNFIFLRDDLGKDILEEVSVDSILNHPSVIHETVDPVVFTYPFVRP